MIFVLPIRTSIRPWRTPYTNYALIAINIFIFALPFISPVSHEELLETFMLTPVRPQTWQFITYAFLHSSFMHIFGNMFFLYLFGNNVNDKLGNVGYLCFYLAGGAGFARCRGVQVPSKSSPRQRDCVRGFAQKWRCEAVEFLPGFAAVRALILLLSPVRSSSPSAR